MDALERALATVIRMELAGLGMSIAKLAEHAGVSRETMSNYLNGKREMPLPVYFKVSEALKIGPRELMRRAEERAR